MKFCDIISEDCVVLDLPRKNKKSVIEAMCKKLKKIHGIEISAKAICDKVCEREKLGTTGIGGGIAIPHARIKGLEKVFVMVGIVKDGMNYEAVDGQPVHVVVLIVAPEGSVDEYANLLAMATSLARDPHLANFLKTCKSEKEVIETLRQIETSVRV